MEKIIVGRDWRDMKKFGDRGTVMIGRHIVGKGEEAHLTNYVYMDVARPHIVLICGKRGTGKSYSAGIIAEEISMIEENVRKNLSVLFIDTMGIYWSMKVANEADAELLKKWNLKPQPINTKVFVPKGSVEDYRKAGIDIDGPFTLSVGELTAEDWIITFNFSMVSDFGILIERAIKKVRDKFGNDYSIEDIINAVEEDERAERRVKDVVINRFMMAEDWNIFERNATRVEDLLSPGVVTVLDVSPFMRVSEAWSIRSMIVGILARKIFSQRLMARKMEEQGRITGKESKTIPMVWIMIDEAHQFLPSDGQTVASGPLLTLVKEGRQPGISLLFITQRPNKLHEDALAQADFIISHRLTSRADIEALRGIMQTYVLEDINEYINSLPREKGTAIILDDNSERIFPVQLRPRVSWHAGESPVAIKEKGILES